eukprot:TRINITY_DN1829_c0_g2_i2.p1 TRINITY_DN1829_c0_g2~~TRINITY_DN1829_c0_g2_i2.p1  ORF type:complete len:257 (+),score=58.48 TRINITY_DN1829_c0_g2_i2:74-844(+)
MRPLETKTTVGHKSDSEEEFYDAKEFWEDNKFESALHPQEKSDHKHSALFKSAIISSKRTFTVPFHMTDKEALNPNSFWNSKPKINENTSDSFSAKNPFLQQSTSSPTSRPEFGIAKNLSHTVGKLPVQPLKKFFTDPSEVQTRNRVPPIAVIRTKKSMKDKLEFDGLCLQQELRSGAQAIWVARFSMDGSYFAVGGEEAIVRVWEIGDYTRQCTLYLTVAAEVLFNPKHLREFSGHTSDVLDISWCSQVLHACLC